MSLFTDRRQHLGPADTQFFTLTHTDAEKDVKMDDSAERDPETGLRRVFIKQGVDREASGSAFYEVDDLRIQVSVHGPQPAKGDFLKQADLVVTTKVETFAGIERQSQMEFVVSDFVKSSLKAAIILKQYPKSSISIQISILTGSNSMATNLAAAVNASTLALVNAGIAMHDMVVASSVILRGKAREILVDHNANDQEMQLAASYYTAAERELVSLKLSGSQSVSREELSSMLSQVENSAVTLRKLLNSYILEDYVADQS